MEFIVTCNVYERLKLKFMEKFMTSSIILEMVFKYKINHINVARLKKHQSRQAIALI